MFVHLERQTLMKAKAQIRALLFDKAFTEVLGEYFNYSNVFLAKNIAELLEHTKINDNVIELEEGKQPLFGLIYNLKPVELEMLKTNIKNNLANDFI